MQSQKSTYTAKRQGSAKSQKLEREALRQEQTDAQQRLDNNHMIQTETQSQEHLQETRELTERHAAETREFDRSHPNASRSQSEMSLSSPSDTTQSRKNILSKTKDVGLGEGSHTVDTPSPDVSSPSFN